MLRAKDVMTRPVISTNAHATVDECISIMLRHHVSGLPVVDDQGQLVGVITEADLLQLLSDPTTTKEMLVGRFMSESVFSVDAEAKLPDVAQQLLARPYRRLPVVRDGQLVGIVARRDVLRSIWKTRIQASYEIEQARRNSEQSSE